jgi:hypothetical protein
MSHDVAHESIVRTCIWITVMLSVILFKGFFSFLVVSDRGQPTWDYRPVPDVPGQSAYATYQLLPFSQHVRGQKGE